MALDRIVAEKRTDLARRKQERPLASFVRQLEPSNRNLALALRRRRPAFVLECKAASPSHGRLRQDYDPIALARAYAAVADALSVVTDGPFFGGSLEHLQAVREGVELPVLCKDFVVDEYQIYEARLHGADAVLLLASVLDRAGLQSGLRVASGLNMHAVVEVHDEEQMQLAADLGAAIIGINNRDLRTLEVHLETTERLAPLAPPGAVVLSESGIRSHEDVRRLRPLVHGFLVGASLVQREDVQDAARELACGRVKICGLTRPSDARMVRQAGAVWGGVIFAKESPRRVSLEQAAAIREAADLRWAGVFVNAAAEEIAGVATQLSLDAVQLHGEETPEAVRALRERLPPGCQIWKAWRVKDRIPALEETGADRLLLDNHSPDRRGGTGQAFDWSLLREHPRRHEFILSGGLHAGNILQAEALGIWALDVNSGVETAPGHKSELRSRHLFAALRRGLVDGPASPLPREVLRAAGSGPRP